MIGGEGPESKASVTDRWYFYQLAAEHQALLVCLEHRYYGKSWPEPVRGVVHAPKMTRDLPTERPTYQSNFPSRCPWPNQDMSTHNLRHLSSAQALADLARFIPFFKEKVNQSINQSISIAVYPSISTPF